MTINFSAEIGGQPFACDATYAGLGSTGADMHDTDFRLCFSDVAIIAADGTRAPVSMDESDWQHAGVALLDFKGGRAACANGTASMNTALRSPFVASTALPTTLSRMSSPRCAR